jgi:hypothetical protein
LNIKGCLIFLYWDIVKRTQVLTGLDIKGLSQPTACAGGYSDLALSELFKNISRHLGKKMCIKGSPGEKGVLNGIYCNSLSLLGEGWGEINQ